MPSLKTLYNRLSEDTWRRDHPFSEDIAVVNELLFHPFATNGQREEQLRNWLQTFQQCFFGRIAAAMGLLHFCILTHDDFMNRTDRQIQKMIRDELLQWTRRSVNPLAYQSSPAHGFVLIAASQRLANAAPNNDLKEFACKLRDLWGCSSSEEQSGLMHWETLYLQHPVNLEYLKFTFSVDFFYAQGDGRWWHDHRCPGGIFFTANSVGHMRKYREWFRNQQHQQDWTLQTAMLTISAAAETPYGKATRLLEMGPQGRPYVKDIACPFSRPESVKPQLKNKDWTRYGGYLHADHSIRSEFFHNNPEPLPDITNKKFRQDLTYLYNPKSKERIVTELLNQNANGSFRPGSWRTYYGKAAGRSEKQAARRKSASASLDIDYRSGASS